MFKFLIGFFAFLFSGVLMAAPVPKPAPLDPMGKPDIDILFYTSIRTDKNGKIYTEMLTVTLFNGTNFNSAEIYGLKHNDFIRKLGESEVIEKMDFHERLAHYRPGAIVELTVEREEKLIKVKIKIGEGVYKEEVSEEGNMEWPDIPPTDD